MKKGEIVSSRYVVRKHVAIATKNHGRRGQGLRHQRSRCGAARDEHHAACGAERQPDQDWQASQQRNRWAMAFFLSIASEARRSAVPLACVTVPSTARPLRFSMTAWPI